MLAPALPDMARDLNTSSGFETYLMMSIFLLAYAVGPFVLAPLSEMYGRVVVLQAANMVFLIFNTVCGFSRTTSQMLVFRFLSGLGGSAPQAVRPTIFFSLHSCSDHELTPMMVTAWRRRLE
jgi:MFS family permease